MRFLSKDVCQRIQDSYSFWLRCRLLVLDGQGRRPLVFGRSIQQRYNDFRTFPVFRYVVEDYRTAKALKRDPYMVNQLVLADNCSWSYDKTEDEKYRSYCDDIDSKDYGDIAMIKTLDLSRIRCAGYVKISISYIDSPCCLHLPQYIQHLDLRVPSLYEEDLIYIQGLKSLTIKVVNIITCTKNLDHIPFVSNIKKLLFSYSNPRSIPELSLIRSILKNEVLSQLVIYFNNIITSNQSYYYYHPLNLGSCSSSLRSLSVSFKFFTEQKMIDLSEKFPNLEHLRIRCRNKSNVYNNQMSIESPDIISLFKRFETSSQLKVIELYDIQMPNYKLDLRKLKIKPRIYCCIFAELLLNEKETLLLPA